MTRQPTRRAASLRGTGARGRPPARPIRPTAALLSERRIRWTLVIYLLCAALVVGKLVEIQVVNADAYAETGVRQRARTIDLPATRGRIYDRSGEVLATSVDSATLYADPRAFRTSTGSDGAQVPPAADPAVVAAELAELIDLDAARIEERLRQDAHFVYLARQLDYERGEAVMERGLPGVGMLTEPHRVYPAGPLGAQVLGFTGIDGDGLQGMEMTYESVLAGEPGRLVLERGGGGLEIASATRELSPAQVGTDLVLTLDREIQHAAEQAASTALEEYDAIGAGVVVLDVETGDVVAMASAPGFDPNASREEGVEDRRNRAVTDVFEPGSAQKALTFAAAIEEGVVSADTRFEARSSVTVSGKRFADDHPFRGEEWSVADIVERSSNVGTIMVAEQLGAERLERYLRRFGYGAPTGSDFPGEASGILMPHEDWWGTSLPTIAIGQGVAVTLLQLGGAYAALANDGVAVEPRLVLGTVGEDGRLTPTPESPRQRAVSSGTAAQVRGMLAAAVAGPDGTGARAQVDGYQVAGKTGTARKPAADARGYSSEYVATFVGFAPVEAPRYAVAVMVDEPTPIYGGLVAAPVFSEVMEAALIAGDVPAQSAGQDLETALSGARRQADEEALRAAERERPGTDPATPAAPPVGDPASANGAG